MKNIHIKRNLDRLRNSTQMGLFWTDVYKTLGSGSAGEAPSGE